MNIKKFFLTIFFIGYSHSLLYAIEDPFNAYILSIDKNSSNENLINIAIKDNIDLAGYPTTAGSIAMLDNVPENDAFIVKKLKQNGFYISGKTNLSEWANFRSEKSISGWSSHGGQTINPFGKNLNPCGSSSGSAVAVASDFTVDATDAACVDTDSRPLCNILANSHVTAKDAIEGVISINKNTACKLSKGCSNTSHNRCRYIDSVFRDRCVVSGDIIESGFLWIIRKYCHRNEQVHELWSLIDLSRTSVLHKIFICYLSQSSICKDEVTTMIDKLI